ncbi:hypothetical protein TeGR_g7273, partial [Tetraparma gracilis]
YQSNPEVMNQQVAKMYQDAEVNPLSGCVPSLVQLPVFIGLYRAVLNLAKSNKLDEPFLFLPSLEGPTYGADPAHGSDWIKAGWEGGFLTGTPPLGWHDTLAYLAIPVFLVVSQSFSQSLLQPPKSDDPNAPDTSAVLKFLPLLIGWFSLNVPSALGCYWVANNLVSTAITLQIKSQFPPPAAAPAAPDAVGTYKPPPPQTTFSAPSRPAPSGFGDSSGGGGGASPGSPKPLTETVVVDAEVSGEVGDEGEGAVDAAAAARTGGKGKKKPKGKKKK